MPRELPLTVESLLTDRQRFTPDSLRAVKALARSKPWRGTVEERLAKIQACCDKLVEAYGLDPIRVVRGAARSSDPMDVKYDPSARTITYPDSCDYISVVTFLHTFCIARGLGLRKRFAWSVNIFKRLFPLSFSRCVHVGPFLFRSNDPRAGQFRVMLGDVPQDEADFHEGTD
jgi:hypothetical protein